MLNRLGSLGIASVTFHGPAHASAGIAPGISSFGNFCFEVNNYDEQSLHLLKNDEHPRGYKEASTPGSRCWFQNRVIRKPVSRVAILKRINETKQEMGEKEMVRYSCVIMLLFVMGCADSSPDPQEVLEKSRKTTAEIEQKLESMKKSTQKAIQKVEEMKQKPQAAADLL